MALEPRNDPNSPAFWQRDPELTDYVRLANGQLAYLPPKVALRHDPTEDCTGEPMVTGYKCPECDAALCPCEYGYGHDCEV
jgi:hypothetical protein